MPPPLPPLDDPQPPDAAHSPDSLQHQADHLARIQQRLHQLRAALVLTRQDEVALRRAVHAERRSRLRSPPPPPPAMSNSPGSESQRRMRSVLRRIRENEGSPSRRRSASPVASTTERRRSAHSDRHPRPSDARPSGVRRGREPADNVHIPSIQSLQSASERLASSNDELRSLLDRPVSGVRPSSLLPDPLDEGERRRKRRRLDSYSRDPPLQKVEYGLYGQVRPGDLEMEVVSADCGNLGPACELQANWSTLGLNSPDNMFRHDLSVYASGGRRSNIVLRHRDERSFTMSKLVIESSETAAPNEALLEGLMFVSTTRDSTFDRTLQYQIHHYPTSHFGPRPVSSVESDLSPSVSSLLRHRANPSQGSSVRPRQRGAQQTDCDQTSESSDGEDTPRPRARPPRQVIVSASLTDDSDSSDESDSVVSPADRLRALRDRHASFDHDSIAQTVARLYGGAAAGGDAHDTDFAGMNDDDHESALAQFDFDDVLRRGNAVAQDRQRRRRSRLASLRERASSVRRQRYQMDEERERWDRWDRFMRQFTEDGDANEHRGEGSDQPGEEDYVRDEDRHRARVSPSPMPHDVLAPPAAVPRAPAIDLLPVTASFTTPLRRHGTRERTLQHPAAPAAGGTTPGAGVSVTTTRKGGGTRVTVAFDPPVAARFILLKLWKGGRRDGVPYSAGHTDRGVEVQRVRVEGWCGVRFHPVTEMA